MDDQDWTVFAVGIIVVVFLWAFVHDLMFLVGGITLWVGFWVCMYAIKWIAEKIFGKD
jgi:hypothetical protein